MLKKIKELLEEFQSKANSDKYDLVINLSLNIEDDLTKLTLDYLPEHEVYTCTVSSGDHEVFLSGDINDDSIITFDRPEDFPENFKEVLGFLGITRVVLKDDDLEEELEDESSYLFPDDDDESSLS